MAMITADEIRERLNLDEIQSAAVEMADRLREGGGWHIQLTPGDATAYQIAVVRRMIWRGSFTQDGWMVANQFAGLYPWMGQPVHEDYAVEKWGAGNQWTGVVMAEFLTRLSAELLG